MFARVNTRVLVGGFGCERSGLHINEVALEVPNIDTL